MKDFRDVFVAEERELRKRRQQAQLEEEPLSASVESAASNGNGSSAPKVSHFPRAGLAISGGGIRSASFGLGFLQSLYRHGVLRQFDYLSTVSGGSYVGSYLSSLIADQTDKEIDWDPHNSNLPQEGRDALPFLPDKNGKQPPDVLRLQNSGQALNQPLKFLNCQLIGMLLINLTAISGLLALAALLALGFRSLYSRGTMDVLSELGLSGDFLQAWAPTLVLFVCWLLTSWMAQPRSLPNPKVESRWRRINLAVFMILVASIFLALASVLVVGDLTMPHLGEDKVTSEAMEKRSNWLSTLSHLAVAAIVGALLPYLRPRALIQSGVNPQSRKERWIFAIASRAFLFGVPLLIFGLLCRENLSGYNESRPNRNLMVPQSISNWHEFWTHVELESNTAEARAAASPASNGEATKVNAADPARSHTVSQKLWATARDVTLTDGSDTSPVIDDLVRVSKAINHRNQSWSPATHWNPMTFQDRIEQRKDFLRWREEVIEKINTDCLSDPAFYRFFKATDLSSLDEATRKKIHRTIQHVERLEDLGRRIRNSDSSNSSGKAKPSELKVWLEETIAADKKTIADPDYPNDKKRAAELRLSKVAPLLEDVRKANWSLLGDYYTDHIRSSDTVFSYVVLDADQKWRMQLALVFGVLFLGLGWMVPLNRIAIHSYYREQLAAMWIKPMEKHKYRIPLNKLNTVSKGGPYHIINGTMVRMSSLDEKSDSPYQLFVFSPLYCGSHSTGFASTGKYDGECDLANAMAISGAAVTPMAASNPLVRVLLLLANFRLGQWMPNPRRNLEGRWYPNPLSILLGAQFRDSEHQNYCFVTDGGHRDNTGIESLLHRRCRVIVAVDASADGTSTFCDLLKLIRAQRVWFGRRIVGSSYHESEIEELCLQCAQEPSEDLLPQPKTSCSEKSDPLLPLGLLTPEQTELVAKSHFVVAEIRYPRDRYTDDAGFGPEPIAKGYLIYIKPSFSDDEPQELVAYRKTEREFPHDPTYDQFFDERRFECYRQLGEHIGDTVWSKLFLNAAKEAEHQEQREWKARIAKGWRELNEDISAQQRQVKPWLSHWSPPAICNEKELPGCHEAVVQADQPSPASPVEAPSELEPIAFPFVFTWAGEMNSSEANGKTSSTGHEPGPAAVPSESEESPSNKGQMPGQEHGAKGDGPAPPQISPKAELANAAGVLGEFKFNTQDVTVPLVELLKKCDEKSPSDYVVALMEAISKLGRPSPDVFESLDRWKTADDAKIGKAARGAIRRLKKKQPKSPPAKESPPNPVPE